ncbi:MAG: 50S ribosome-binding GTPase [Phycisphaeraceae bacterium]|nr:50S ribosome-binding GTPase [Phycisphaeraceae bacterium]
MPTGDTIVAMASAPGWSARAIVRLSGPAVGTVLAQVCGVEPSPGLKVARVRLAPSQSLPVLAIVYRGPRSYTGEDAAELLLPGNPYLVERVISTMLRLEGVRSATPGEFTARAYLNGKRSLDEAEGVAATIAAVSDEQLRAARDVLSGAAGVRYRAWTEEVATLLALVEAGIDFTDQEDVVAISKEALGARAGKVAAAIEARLGGREGVEAARSLPRVVLAGAPNAGKSTLFNALLGRERAVVSPIAGTTRDAIEEELDLSRDLPGAGKVMLVDLAGLDEEAAGGASGVIGAMAQDAAAGAIASADAVLHCDPAGRFPVLATRGVVIRVRTKADQPGEDAIGQAVPVCALDGWNLGVLRRAIAESASAATGSAEVIPRHARALREAALRLREACAAEAELAASSLRQALDALGEVTGRISPDDVIGRIFATFCIGK